MADENLTDLPELTAPKGNDWLYIVDESDTTDDAEGSSKQVEVEGLWTPNQPLRDGLPYLRQMVEGPVRGTGTTTTLVMPLTPTQGNLLVALVKTVGGRTCTPQSGSWTTVYGPTSTTDSSNLYAFTHTVGSGESNSYQFDFSGTAEYNSVILVEVAGGSTVQSATSTSGVQFPSITLSPYPALVLFQYGQNDALAGKPLPSLDDYAGGQSRWTLVYQHALDYHCHTVWWRQVTTAALPSDTYVRNAAPTNAPRGLVAITT